MLRRNFLARLAAGTAALGFGSGGDAFAYAKRKQHKAPHVPNKLDRIAISTWSLRNYFNATRRSDFNLPGPMLALLDFPDLIVDKYKVRHFEFCTTHFGSTESTYLREIKYALVRTGSTIVNIPVDIPRIGQRGNVFRPGRENRMAALDAVKLWVDVAYTLGARSVRVGPGKVDTENLAPTVESYKALAIYAQAKGIRVIVENHGDFGTDHPEDLVRPLKLPAPGALARCRTSPTFLMDPRARRH